MTRADSTRRRQTQRDQALRDLKARSDLALDTLDEGQCWLLYAALNLLVLLQPVPELRRVVGFLLCHCRLGLKLQAVAAALELCPRALSTLKKTQPADLLRSLRSTPPGKKPKLRPEHVGAVARFLVDNPQAQLSHVLEFVRKQLGVSVKRHALRRFFLRYSLGELNKERVAARPLFGVTLPSAAPLS